MITLNKNKKMVKVVTLILLQVFLGWNISSAAVSDRSMWQQRGKASVLTTGSSVSGNSLEQENLQKSLFSEFFVPENAGTINELWVPAGMSTKEALSSSKLLIHIRDAHCNYEAQGNIAKIIDNFTKSNGVNLVSIEGGRGEIDYTMLNAFPDYTARHDVTDAFMEAGRLCGAEFANINAAQYHPLFGAENGAVYDSNLANFRETLKYKEDGLKFVSQIKTALDSLKANMYTPELKDLEEKLALYNNHEISFVDYCQYLYNLPAAEPVRSGYKNFALLMEAIKVQELVDFSQIDTEKSALMTQLAKNLSKDELSKMSRATIDFQRGKLSTANYYHLLNQMATDKKIDMAAYKNLKPYIVYLNVYEKINSADLFKEKETLEAEVKRSFFKNVDQARLDKLSKNASILEKLFSVRLTNDDLAYFKNNRTDFTAYEFQSFIKEQAPKFNLTLNVDFSADPLAKYLPKLEAFYDEAKTRDEILAQNTLNQMDAEGSRVGVLVAGGFHTAGMTTYLRSKNIPYMIVTPRILKEDVNNPYLKLISGEAMPVDKFLAKEQLFSMALRVDKASIAGVKKMLAVAPEASGSEVDGWLKTYDPKNDIPTRTGYDRYVLKGGVEVGVANDGTLVIKGTPDQHKTILANVQQVSGTNVVTIGTYALAKTDPAKAGGLKDEFASAGLDAKLVAAKTADVEETTLGTFVAGNKIDDYVTAVKAKILELTKGTEGTDPKLVIDQSDVDAVVLRRGLKLLIEGLPTDLTLAEALDDQHIAVTSGKGVVLISLRHLARLAANHQLGDKDAVMIAAAKIAHELVEAKRIASLGRKAAHAEAVKAIDSKVKFTDPNIQNIVDKHNLAGLDKALDKKTDAAAQAANTNLAVAEDAFLKSGNKNDAVRVTVASISLFKDTDTHAAEAALRRLNPALLSNALSKAADGEFLGITTVEETSVGALLLTAPQEPAVGSLVVNPTINQPITQETVNLLKDRGVSVLVIAPGVIRESVIDRILADGFRAESKEQIERDLATPKLVINAYRELDGFRITVQPVAAKAEEQADNDRGAALMAQEANAAAAAAAQTSKKLKIQVQVPLLYDAGKLDEVSLKALMIGVANVAKASNIYVELVGGTTEQKQEIHTRLQGTDAALRNKIFQEGDAFLASIRFDATSIITSAGSPVASGIIPIEVQPRTPTNKYFRFDAALPLAALVMADPTLTTYREIILSLLRETRGLSDTDVIALRTSLSLRDISVRPMDRFDFNMDALSVKLAVAA